MALPSSGQLGINRIRIELGASATNQSLRAFSSTVGFSSPDKITDFYGYTAPEAYVGSTFQSGTKFICTQARNTTFYHDGTGTFPVVSDTIYTDFAKTTNAGSGYSRVNVGYILTNSSGVVTNTFICI